jgi:hypothetical protein
MPKVLEDVVLDQTIRGMTTDVCSVTVTAPSELIGIMEVTVSDNTSICRSQIDVHSARKGTLDVSDPTVSRILELDRGGIAPVC